MRRPTVTKKLSICAQAFNATEAYSNHEIVKFLEKIGAQYGACQVRGAWCLILAPMESGVQEWRSWIVVSKIGAHGQGICLMAEVDTFQGEVSCQVIWQPYPVPMHNRHCSKKRAKAKEAGCAKGQRT